MVRVSLSEREPAAPILVTIEVPNAWPIEMFLAPAQAEQFASELLIEVKAAAALARPAS
jgi:hypothetical protein